MSLFQRLCKWLAALGGGCALFACAKPADEAPRTLPLAEAETAMKQRLPELLATSAAGKASSKAPEWIHAVTTWLPSEWPPTPRTVWSRYAYALDVSMDGVSGVSAPYARVERAAGDAKVGTLIPMGKKLERIGRHPVRPHAGWKYTLEDERRMLDFALALDKLPPADSRSGIGLVSYYQSWRLGHAEIAEHLRARHQAFFEWLEKQRQL